ncbi:prolyl 4-hydroxylase subunit alpha-3-like [Branchiostoma floridae x Branchiostoma belcheri]
MSLRLLIWFLVPATLYAAKNVGYYSAIVRVEHLLLAERKMVGKVKQHISQGLGEVTGDLRSYVDSYGDDWLHPPRDHDDPLHLAHHPVGAYLLIKRLSQENVQDIFQQAQNLIGKPNILVQVPDQEDLEMSAFALVRLQAIYNLDIHSLAHGQIVMAMAAPQSAQPRLVAISSPEPFLALDLWDTMFLGNVASDQNHFEDAIRWYSYALGSAYGLKEKVDAMSKMASAHAKLKQYDQSLAIYQEALQLDPNNQILYADYDDTLQLAAVDDGTVEEEDPELKALVAKSQHLCRMDVVQNPAPRRLKCRYVRDSPHLYISPARVEVLHRRNPQILMYHDVITQTEAKKFRTVAFPRFKRSTSMDDQGLVYIDKYAVSEKGVITDAEETFIAKMSRRVGQLTGLSTELPHAEPIMVLNYGLGGAIQHHLDYFAEVYHRYTAIDGNRMMTFLTYLNEVEAGGAIVFPEIDLITPAVQNAALLVQNLKKSGDYEPLSLHAGCPVLMGSKWTAVKWIREYGNEFKRPCSLSPDE